jgi:hypothetical protein
MGSGLQRGSYEIWGLLFDVSDLFFRKGADLLAALIGIFGPHRSHGTLISGHDQVLTLSITTSTRGSSVKI